jgi:hypothetical protein
MSRIFSVFSCLHILHSQFTAYLDQRRALWFLRRPSRLWTPMKAIQMAMNPIRMKQSRPKSTRLVINSTRLEQELNRRLWCLIVQSLIPAIGALILFICFFNSEHVVSMFVYRPFTWPIIILCCHTTWHWADPKKLPIQFRLHLALYNISGRLEYFRQLNLISFDLTYIM